MLLGREAQAADREGRRCDTAAERLMLLWLNAVAVQHPAPRLRLDQRCLQVVRVGPQDVRVVDAPPIKVIEVRIDNTDGSPHIPAPEMVERFNDAFAAVGGVDMARVRVDYVVVEPDIGLTLNHHPCDIPIGRDGPEQQ